MADANYSSVSLLLHCDGDDNSTTFVDVSPTPKTVTAYGNAHIETDQSKFGGASAYFDGTGDYLSIPNNAAFAFGSGDFTIEAWVYISNTSGYKSICSLWAVGAAAFHFSVSGNKLYFAADASGVFGFTGTSQSISANTWTHVAVVRSGSVFTLYVNGNADSSTYTSSNAIQASTGALLIGVINTTDQGYFAGYIDDLRITKGVARYTENFTPPAAQFYNPRFSVSGTVTDENGDPCERTIYVIDRATGSLLATTASDSSTGEYSVDELPDTEVLRVVLAEGSTLYNDIIDRVIPSE